MIELAKELDDGGRTAKVLKEVGDSSAMGALHYAVVGEGKTLMCKYLVEELKLDVNVQGSNDQNLYIFLASVFVSFCIQIAEFFSFFLGFCSGFRQS